MLVLGAFGVVLDVGRLQMECDRVPGVLGQCELAAHRATGGDRRRNCSWVSMAPILVVWENQVETSRAEGDARPEGAFQLG